jgi:microcystin-dependent protein
MPDSNQDLILHLVLDRVDAGKVKDVSGRGHDGVIGGQPQLVQDPTFGQCLRFGGGRDHVIVQPLPIFPAAALTVSCWVKSAETQRPGALLSYANQESRNAFLLLDHRDLDVYVSARHERSTGIAACDGLWHHLAVTWQSSDGQIKLYKDGVLAHSGMLARRAQILAGGALVLGQEQDAVGGEFDLRQAYRGDMAHVRLYQRVLTLEEIQQERQSDIAAAVVAAPPPPDGAGEPFLESHPLAFRLVDENHRPAIYIEHHHAQRMLLLEITNASTKAVELLAPAVGQAGPDHHHFALRFRPGVLSSFVLSKIQSEEEEWLLSGPFQSDGVVSFYLLSTQPRVLAPGEEVVVPLQFANAAAQNRSHQTQVETGFRRLKYSGASRELAGHRLVRLQIVDLRGKRDIPLYAGFIGSNTVLNDGESTNALTLQIANASHAETLQFNPVTSRNPTRFTLTFDVQQQHEQRPWALATDSQVQGIEIATDHSDWEVIQEFEGEAVEWVVTPRVATSLAPGEALRLELANIVTSLPSGVANLYLRYEQVPSYRDGQIICAIEKAPLLYRDVLDAAKNFTQQGRVGIGVHAPDGILEINGTVPGSRLKIGGTGGDAHHLTSERELVLNAGQGGFYFRRVENFDDLASSTDLVHVTPKGNVGIGKSEGIQERLEVEGRIKDQTGYVMPVGGIIMWSGLNVPPGWALCDGRTVNGIRTPDLRGRFIVGYSGAGDYAQPGDLSEGGATPGNTGGAESVPLTVQQLPSHSHAGSTSVNGAHNHWMEGSKADGLALRNRTIWGETTVWMYYGGGWNSDKNNQEWRGHVNTDTVGDHAHAVTTESQGGNAPHENRPPYYVLAFIMKV